jgi:3-oxoacyl-[acyl-carrier-protein] synthase-3
MASRVAGRAFVSAPRWGVTGWGAALPTRVVTNADLAEKLDTSDEWVRTRTGIRERRVGGLVSELAAEAGRHALARAGCDGSDVELLILATTTPDQAVPATSSKVHHALGIAGGAYDLNAACAGFVYGLVAAAGAIATGTSSVLLVGADCLSRITDPLDRSTAVLFADGAGAILLQSSTGSREAAELDAPPGMPAGALLGTDLGVDGTAYELLGCEHGGYMTMEGSEVFRRAVRITVSSATAALARSGLKPDDVALFVPHQANLRIIEAACDRLGIGSERTAVILDRTGNTSAASIPLALAEAADAGRLSAGDYVLLSGFGAGMTWASAVLRWGSPL